MSRVGPGPDERRASVPPSTGRSALPMAGAADAAFAYRGVLRALARGEPLASQGARPSHGAVLVVEPAVVLARAGDVDAGRARLDQGARVIDAPCTHALARRGDTRRALHLHVRAALAFLDGARALLGGELGLGSGLDGRAGAARAAARERGEHALVVGRARGRRWGHASLGHGLRGRDRGDARGACRARGGGLGVAARGAGRRAWSGEARDRLARARAGCAAYGEGDDAGGRGDRRDEAGGSHGSSVGGSREIG